jgi:hypothetical protein
MKSATEHYAEVRAITKEEIDGLIPLVFTPAWKKARKTDAVWEEAQAAWGSEVKVLSGFIPDRRAINFIAADREDGVYSFVQSTTRNRKEVWFYDGECCPDPDTVEVVWREE